jgi:hypothetical protein
MKATAIKKPFIVIPPRSGVFDLKLLRWEGLPVPRTRAEALPEQRLEIPYATSMPK